MSVDPGSGAVPPTHQKPRPSAAWWVLGGACFVAGLLLGAYLLVSVVVTTLATNATVTGGDGATLVEVDEGLNRNDQTADSWFEATSNRVVVECSGAGSVQVGQRPGTPAWVGGLAGAVALPLLLLVVGVVILVVTGVRLATAGARR